MRHFLIICVGLALLTCVQHVSGQPTIAASQVPFGSGSSAYAILKDGSVWAWGLNNDGQLGDGTTINRPTPVLISGLTGVAGLSAGRDKTLVSDPIFTLRRFVSVTNVRTCFI